jgi:hypothetical protein
MNFKLLLPLALLLPLSTVFAGENALFRAEYSCLKLPPSDARTECMKKEREAAAEFEKERKKEEAAFKRQDGERPKKNDLCFTRRDTGEVVCPN